MYLTVKEFCDNAQKHLKTVSSGEELIITFHGKRYAKLVPFSSKENNVENDDELFGIWKNRKNLQNVNATLRKMRKNRFHK